MNPSDFIFLIALWITSLPPLLIVLHGLLATPLPQDRHQRPRELYWIIGVHVFYYVPYLMTFVWLAEGPANTEAKIQIALTIVSMIGLYSMQGWAFVFLALGFLAPVYGIVAYLPDLRGVIGFVEHLQSMATWMMLGWYLQKIRGNRGE